MATGSLTVGATGNQDVDGLLGGFKWNDNNVLFNFPSVSTYYPGNYGTVQAPGGAQVSFPAGFVAVSASFENMVRKALGEFSAVSNLTFTEVADAAASNVSVARTTALGPETALGFRGYGFFPGSSARAGDIWFDDSTVEVGDTAVVGRGTYALVMHELGHAMGLKHAHEGGGPGATAMPTQHDHNDYSIMSYRRYEGGPTSGTTSETFGRTQSLMMYDILALQTMYGANYTTNSTNTVYTFSQTTGQMSVNGVGGDIPGNGAANANRIYRTIWDGGGVDTYDLSNYGTNLDMDLTPGGKSTLSPGQLAIVDTATARTATGNLFNALMFNGDTRSLIENAIGGTGNDTIKGNQAANSLTGNAGNDTLNGGAGADQMRGGRDNDTYVVDDAGDVVTELAAEGNDTVQTTLAVFVLGADVENLTFTDNASHTGIGNALANVMTGNTGNDTFFAGDGVDTLVGGDGSDTLVAHSDGSGLFLFDADNLSGGNGNDTLYGDGFDTLNGGADFDVLQVINDFAVSLDLAATGIEYVLSGFGNDTYNAAAATSTIEVYGSGGNDIITGGSGNDNLWGGVHNDTLTGNNGDDLLVGDLGADSLSGGIGIDRLYIDSSDTFIDGGDGFDAAYIATGSGINLNMAVSHLEWVADFAGGNDTINASGVSVRVEIYGAGGTDAITGGSGNDFLWGEGGNDTVTGNDGSDVLVGGIGADTLTGGLGTDVLYGNSGGGADVALDTFVFTNNWGTDFVFDFEVGTDKLDMTGVTGVHALSDLIITGSGGNAIVSFLGNSISVVGKADLITASDFLFDDGHAGNGVGEINASVPFDQIIGSATPLLVRGSALDFGDDPYDSSDFSELTAGAQEIFLDGNTGGSSLESEMFSFEVLSRGSGATLVKTENEISYNDPGGKKLDFSVEISGTVLGVSVVRGVDFPFDDPMTLEHATDILEGKLDDILFANTNVSPADQWDKAILHVIAYDQQKADMMAAAWNFIDPATKADTAVIITTTYGQDLFLYA